MSILCTVSLFFFFACNRTVVENEEIEGTEAREDNISFIEIISNMPQLNLPYTLYCGLDESLHWADDFGSKISNFMPENSIIAGKLPINNNNIYLIYGISGDIIYPYLNIYNNDGRKIDSLPLYIGYCAGDESEISTTITTINKDFSIIMSDTTHFIHYTDENEKIIDSIIVKKRHLKLTNNGLYKRQNEENIKVQ